MIVTEWGISIADVLSGIETFINETSYPITYNYSNAREYIWRIYNDSYSDIIVSYDKDNIFTGFAIVHTDNETHTEYFGYVAKFYVMPSARGTGAGRQLLKEVVDWFDQRNCVVSFATATAGIGQDQSFINLFQKYQYKNIGGTLIRKTNG